MNWFQGEITEAIAKSKTKQAIFVVFVEGKDEKSSQIADLINRPEIVAILGSGRFVAIKIEADSISYQQFSQIFKSVSVPSVYFIGKQGSPLEIVTEVKDTQSLLDQLNGVLQKGGYSPVQQETAAFIASEAAPSPDVVCENGVCTLKKPETPSTSGEAPKETVLSTEEKVERAKELVERKREEKRRQEEEEVRQKELERRKMGQNVQHLKRWQNDQELKQLKEERDREKRETQAARDRVLAQIAQDKAERAAKFSPPQTSMQQSSQASPRPVNNGTARIQFRLPDGRTATNDFDSTETLEAVHSYIRAHLNLTFTTYALSTTFPRREFTEADRTHSLLDLELIPSAVILILPLSRGAVATNTEGGLTGLIWSLLTPILSLYAYLKGWVFGSSDHGASGSGKRAADASDDANSSQSKVRRSGETTVIRRQGNVHRLSNKSDSDEDNNTWNGNSTQQM